MCEIFVRACNLSPCTEGIVSPKVCDPCPELDGLLEDGDQLVKHAQELAYDVLAVRRTFEACVSDLCDKFAAKSGQLDELRSFGELFISGGLASHLHSAHLHFLLYISHYPHRYQFCCLVTCFAAAQFLAWRKRCISVLSRCVRYGVSSL